MPILFIVALISSMRQSLIEISSKSVPLMSLQDTKLVIIIAKDVVYYNGRFRQSSHVRGSQQANTQFGSIILCQVMKGTRVSLENDLSVWNDGKVS